jgi:hypothetical protein
MSARLGRLLVIAAAFCPAGVARGQIVQSGDFLSEVLALKAIVSSNFNAGSNNYVAPTTAQLTAFRTLATSVYTGNVAIAVTQAAALNYDVLQFADTATNRVYIGLVEKNNAQARGWGSYFLNLSTYQADRLIEVPHTIFDINTENVGAKVYQQAAARGFLMAGAQRNANGDGTADVAHLTTSIFETVHEVWNGPTAQTTAWQMHGFDLSGTPSFPTNTAAVASNGAGAVTANVLRLNTLFDSNGFPLYNYNTLSTNNALNVQVNFDSGSNTVINGSTFSSLGATTNVQGNYSRGLGGDFLHIEMEQSIRFNSSNLDLAASEIALAVQGVPEPGTFGLGAMAAATLVAVRRRRLKCISSISGGTP